MDAKAETAVDRVANETDSRELIIARVFDAPREVVWRAWTEPDRMARWAGPRGFTLTVCEMDDKGFRFTMRSPDGDEHRARGAYREMVERERLVYTWAWVDAEGRPGHETFITVTFADYGERTKLTLHQTRFESVAARDGHREGWESAFDCLADYLAAA
jgi:uncharacterized protein YndB with AHSA1/START domain